MFSDSTFSGIDPMWYYHSNVEYALHKVPNTEYQWVFIQSFRRPSDFDYYHLYNIELECTLEGDTLRFPSQSFLYDDSFGFTPTDGWGDYRYDSSTQGYFRNDSLFFSANPYWMDGDGINLTYLWGVKKR